MTCQRCASPRVIDVSGKCSDLFTASLASQDYDGYVLDDIGIGGGDEMEFAYCLDCGQIQGSWPVPLIPQLESPPLSATDQTFADAFCAECYDTDMAEPNTLAIKLLETDNPPLIAATLRMLAQRHGMTHAVRLYSLLKDWDRSPEIVKPSPDET